MRRDLPPDMARADWLLRNWAHWMRRPELRLSYPAKSAGLESGGVSGEDAFDILCSQADEHAARTADAAVESLPIHLQCVIHHAYLSAVYRFRGDPRKLLEEARELFWGEAQKRGLC